MLTVRSRQRDSGVLLPISALPGPFGIGDLGPTALRYVDWLQHAGQRYWQVLPLSIPDQTGSPYASLSSAAGNWLFISPELLVEQRLLPPGWRYPRRRTNTVAWRSTFRTKWRMIRVSYRCFLSTGNASARRRYAEFQRRERHWLEDYVLFQALKDHHDHRPWWEWEGRWRNPAAARRHIDRRLRDRMSLHAYAQWLWTEQWAALRRHAHRRGVRIIGDMPFFVRADSVDVWAHPGLFLIDPRGHQSVVAGVPPDPFSKEGQRWGNPLYHWSAHRRSGYRWWVERFRLLHERVDIVRFDHFRGLVRTWQIPVRSKLPSNGRWVPSPGRQLLRTVKRRVPHLNLIVEDLGPAGYDADELRRAFHAPTIRVMLFGWNGLARNPHAPFRVTPDVVYYTGTHDTNTIVGWWREESKPYERAHVREHVGRVKDVAAQMIMSAAKSGAGTIIVPMQDVLGLGAAARFNRPGRRRGNWSWRTTAASLTPAVARKLLRISRRHG